MSFPYVAYSSDGLPLLTCCQRACPVGTDVSAYIALIAQGRYAEALSIAREENPFPGTCGRVCDHECEIHCRRAESDQPVAIRALKRFLADQERRGQVQWPERIEPSQREKVAIVGAGPAGLTAAADLLRQGFAVSVFEALPKAGGMMRVGIPEYRLPTEVLDFDLEYLRRLGVEILLNKALGRDFTLSDLKARGYQAVLLSTGAHGSRGLKIKGTDLPNVMFGIDMLREVKLSKPPKLGQRIVVIGGGDVAMDTARTALRLGAKRVDLFCLESREKMPAHDWETREALDKQIHFNGGWGPVEFVGNDCVQGVKFVACSSVFDEKGKFAPQFDDSKTTTIEADTVLVAIGQLAQFAHVSEDGLEVTSNQLYQVDPQTLQTTADWVFAAGEAVYGTATVIKAVASGHRAATSLCEYLQGQPLTGRWEPPRHDERIDRIEIPPGWEELPPVSEPELAANKRVQSFSEVKLGLTEAAALIEASRCMRCDYETDSYSYNRAIREQIYHMARDVGGNEAACLEFLQRRLIHNQRRPSKGDPLPSFDDLVFLPANLTRLVIDPYREQCETACIIGARASNPLKLVGPVIMGGIPFSELPCRTVAALGLGAHRAGSALRMPLGIDPPYENLPVIRRVPLSASPESVGVHAAIELVTNDPGAVIEPNLLCQIAEMYRDLASGMPIGLSVGPEHVAPNVRSAVEAGLDFVTLCALGASNKQGRDFWAERNGQPRIDVLAEAVYALREINREEHIDLIYLGCIRGGGDMAKALALGAQAVIIGQASLIALSGFSPEEQAPDSCEDERDIEQGAERIFHFVCSMLMEASILARGCGKTDLHNLEPEDLRSLSVESSQATGIPLVGSDVIYKS